MFRGPLPNSAQSPQPTLSKAARARSRLGSEKARWEGVGVVVVIIGFIFFSTSGAAFSALAFCGVAGVPVRETRFHSA
jgi:hypothetical protein